MRMRVLIRISGLGLLIAIPIAVSAHRFAAAQVQLDSTNSALKRIDDDRRAILELRAQQQRVGIHDRPAQDVIAQLTSMMADIGLSNSHLKSLTPESDSLVAPDTAGQSRSQFKKQSLRVTLDNVTIAEMGALLLEWRQRQKIWTPTRIELTHVRSQTPANNLYNATILISAIYLADR